ncbi:MAG TPA: lipoprotein-releasing ABC transporter permease subunit [Candidatus Acidoferrales bacterium]|nr:lipoprotein-releasing ABC transporter permease subunit [Candidatus Acidoferrales bacterium]
MRYELLIGLRYLQSRRRERFISLITVISILGVMIGVMTLNVVMAVMTGFEEALRDRLLGINAHIAIVKPGDVIEHYRELAEKVTREDGVVAAAPLVFGQVMLTSGKRVAGVVVRGVDPELTQRVVDIGKYVKEGTLADLERRRRLSIDGQTVELPGMIVGSRLAGQLGVMVGDPVQVVSPLGTPTAFGVMPKIRRFYVAGRFDSGMLDYDNTLVFMSLEEAQKFFDLGNVATTVEVRVRDVHEAPEIARKIQRAIGLPYWAEDWTQLWPNLFAALRLEKTVYFLVLLLMILVGAFNIVSTLTMVVMEKRKDIAILQSMGATRRSIKAIFLVKGCIIGLVGTLLGVVLGYVLCLLIQEYQFIHLPEGVFLISTVPVRIYFSNFALVTVASFLICLAASLYPARQAAKLDPVEIIRYE